MGAQASGGAGADRPEAGTPPSEAPPPLETAPPPPPPEATAQAPPPAADDAPAQDGRDGAPAAPAPETPAANGQVATEPAALPSEGAILARLLASIAQCPNQSMALADILDRLPDGLRQLVADRDTICKWLRSFPELLEVSGEPGQEQVTLTVGRLPRLVATEPAASPASTALAAAANSTATAPEAEPAPAKAPPQASAALGDLQDSECTNPATVQLRGLPFRATIADVKAFLGDHASHLTTSEPPIRLLLNRDGRPSGFARVQFASPHAAEACREGLHRRQMGDRYVEVLACSDRSGRMRNRRATESGPDGTGAAPPADATAEYMERERVLAECREHMRMPGRNQLLLSMLGIALSPPARAYLRRANLGLKHFLARLPNEFRVEGPKGCERVIWCGAGSTVADMSAAVAFSVEAQAQQAHAQAQAWQMSQMSMPAPEEPGTPKVAASPSIACAGSGAFATPTDWGTPVPWLANTAPMGDTGGQCAGMDFSSGWNPNWGGAGAWGTSWVPPWPADGNGDVNLGAMSGNAQKVPGGQEAQAPKSTKRGGRSETAPTRSHAHLHPQSHPFANRPADGAGPVEKQQQQAQAPSTTVAVLRLRGLPFSVSVQDVLAFFAQHDVADRIADGPQAAQLLPKANGRPSGQAVVQMRSRADAEQAQRALNKQYIGGRYIEVFAYGGDGDSGLDGMQMPDGPAGGAPGPPQPQPGAGLPSGDTGAEWMQGMGGHPWQALPWANLVGPPPVPGSVEMPGGGGGQDEWASIFGSLFRGDGSVGAGFAMAAATPPVNAPSRPTLQI